MAHQRLTASSPPSSTSVAIIGAGSVGSTIAYALILGKVSSEIILVDVDEARCQGQVDDLSDAQFVSNTRIKTGTFQEAGQADIIVITAGAKQRIGESRQELVSRNYDILKSCISGMSPLRHDAIILLVSNPVDVITYFAQKLSGLPPNQVLGTGTTLDTERLRVYLSSELGMAEESISANVLGEHGDSQFVNWSAATVAGQPLDQLLRPDFDKAKCAEYVRRKAYKIIEAKGATYFGIAAVTASICQAIFLNSRIVRPLSHFQGGDLGCCISLPAIIGRSGIVSTLHPPLTLGEQDQLKASAEAMRAVISKFA